ncbi:MAG: SGNH/GDSL hydrolase family protein [Kiritimatiellae bacterium]|nr:SGNH/GDSL hydrolase family protein [Kiritimatiellia bacterium]
MKSVFAVLAIAPIAVFADAIADNYPVAENVRGHENTEWSTSYAYHLTDANKDLPRILLVGDSICQGYQGKVRAKLEGKANVTYWASSYCVTSPGYLRLLAFYLDEAKYDVIHFNNGLHSCDTPIADYAKAYRAAIRLIKKKQPKAKIVWASSTPLNATDSRVGKVAALNAAARRAAESVGDVAENDLYSLADPLDRKSYWVDTHHYTDAGYELLASQVVEKVVAAWAK